jgi:hypothetical protein
MANTANSPKEKKRTKDKKRPKEKKRSGSKAETADRVETGRVEKKLRFPNKIGVSS